MKFSREMSTEFHDRLTELVQEVEKHLQAQCETDEVSISSRDEQAMIAKAIDDLRGLIEDGEISP